MDLETELQLLPIVYLMTKDHNTRAENMAMVRDYNRGRDWLKNTTGKELPTCQVAVTQLVKQRLNS